MAFTYTQWNGISIAEIVFYSLAILVTIYPYYRIFIVKKSYFKWFFIRFFLALACKLIAGSTTTAFIKVIENANNNDYNISLIIAAFVMNPIFSGFIITLYASTTIYVSKVLKNGKNVKKSYYIFNIYGPIKDVVDEPTNVEAWDVIVDKLTLISMILNIVGASLSGSYDLSNSKSLLEAGSIIYLIAFLVAVFCVTVNYRQIQKDRFKIQKELILILQILLVISPFLIVRLLNSIIGSFKMVADGGGYRSSFSNFSYLFGNWKIYAFMVFMEECIVVVLLIIITFIVIRINEHPLDNFTDSFKNLEE